MQPLAYLAHHQRDAAPAAAAVVLLLGGLAWWIRQRRPSAAELEGRRRGAVATHGRIIDGVLTGVEPAGQTPAVLFYSYRVAGVTYECSQDVSALPPPGPLLVDVPVQVRYLPHNPGNSVVLAESWNGLWKYDA